MAKDNYKAGLFVFGVLILLVIMILRVSQGGFLFSSSYNIYLDLDSAVGLSKNTPVLIAGVEVGIIDKVTLSPNNKARAVVALNSDLKLPVDTVANVKTTGILGDAYIELVPGAKSSFLEKDAVISNVTNFGDFNTVTNKLSSIADDVKAITSSMKQVMAGDDSSFNNSMRNIEKITKSLSNVTGKNEQNLDVIIANLKALSQNLNAVVAHNMSNVDQTMYNIRDITGTVARGEGTVGKLIKDETTVNKLNNTLDSISQTLSGVNRLQLDLGMHTEYLAGTGDVKNYVQIDLKPRPDKYFLFQIVSDPDPSFNTGVEETTVTSGGVTNTITTRTKSKKLNGYRFSAQIAKKWQDFTIRGGLIESSGGVGLDYNKGLFGLQFSAFDFKSEDGQKPHLKAMATAQITKTMYVLGGFDDFINPNQDLAWFVGAGLTFTDDDLKSLLGLFAAGSRVR